MHHTVNEIPSKSLKKYDWQKSHSQNLSGSSKAYKPNKISKKIKFKSYETWKIKYSFIFIVLVILYKFKS